MFKKLALIVILLLVLSASASAYSAIVTVKFNSLKAPNGTALVLPNVVSKVWNMDGSQVPGSTSAVYPMISAELAGVGVQTSVQSPIIAITSGTQYYITVEAPAVCAGATCKAGCAYACWGWCTTSGSYNAKKTSLTCLPTGGCYGTSPASANFGGTCDLSPSDPMAPVAAGVASPGTLNLGASKNITFTAP